MQDSEKKDGFRKPVEGIQFWAAVVASTVVFLELTILSSSDSASSVFVCLIFMARQISSRFQYALVLFSILAHVLLALIPTFAIAHRGFDDGGFERYLSLLNLVILVPWALNLTIIHISSGKKKRVATILGSIGNAGLSVIFSGMYLVFVTNSLLSYQSEPTDVLVAISMKAGLLIVEAALFLRMASLGE